MTTWLVTRHPGAREWLARQAFDSCYFVSHLDASVVEPGDLVIGTLPVQLVAAVCARGARYVHLSLNLPASQRGAELTSEQMTAFDARLQEFTVTKKL